MKKKFALLLSVLSLVMMLGACGTDPSTVDYNGVTYEQLYQQSVSVGTALAGATQEQIEEQIVYLETNYASEAGLEVELCRKWLSAMEVSGNYVGLKENGFSVAKSGKTLTTDLVLVFEKREVTFQLVYNYHDMQLTGVTVEPVYTTGEKMTKAGLNTVICMSIVFTVLISISLIISCFKIFPYLEEKKKAEAAQRAEAARKANAANQVVTDELTATQVVEEPDLSQDMELVAVIAAAIAAYEGTSTDGFVVRSIRRR